MGNQSSIQRLNFEDIQESIKNKNNYIIINTLSNNSQECLIPNTIHYKDEENIINNMLSNNTNIKVIIYGKNTNDMTIYDKYEQLIKLGFRNVYIYPGGMFEWLCLQDIYGTEEFPTKGQELDILKFKPSPKICNHYLLGDE